MRPKRPISCLAPLLFAAFYKHTAANNALADTVLEFEAEAEWEPFRTCTGVDSMPIACQLRRSPIRVDDPMCELSLHAQTGVKGMHHPTYCTLWPAALSSLCL